MIIIIDCIDRTLHERIRYEERGPAVSVEAKKVRSTPVAR
jgi:hypothetical protein